jgi:hypothetical protein
MSSELQEQAGACAQRVHSSQVASVEQDMPGLQEAVEAELRQLLKTIRQRGQASEHGERMAMSTAAVTAA